MKASHRSRAFARLAVLAMLATTVPPAASEALAQTDAASVPRISQDDFKQALAAKAILVIDVRDAQAYASGHIPGAVSTPAADLDKYVDRLRAQTKPIVAYCA